MKIKTKICQFTAIIAVLCTSYSCSDDFYKEEAGSRITPDEHYLSQRDMYTSIMGTYVPLQDAYPKLLLIDGLRSDMLDTTEYSDRNMIAINDQNLSLSNPYLDASGFYRSIINANEILKNLDKVWINEPTTISFLPKFVKGSLITIRAQSYLTIARLFGEAKLLDDNMLSINNKGIILTKKAMIDTLINQLRPYVFTDPKLVEPVLFGPNTKALLGELYLENQQYDSAAVYLKMAMESYNNNDQFKITDNFSKENWQEIFFADINSNSFKGAENIDLVPFDAKRNQYNVFASWTVNYLVKPSQILIDSFKVQQSADPKSPKGDIYRGKGITFDTLPNTNINYIKKYELGVSDPNSSIIIISRAADVHLMLAEALNRLGDYQSALLLVNQGIKSTTAVGYAKWKNNVGIRGRAYLNPRTLPSNIDINNADAVKTAVEDIIIEERKLELAFEGKRWFDLVRIAERRKEDPNYLANKVAAKFADPAKAASIRSLLQDKSKWYLPLN